MNVCASKPPMPFSLKRVKLWTGEFYLNSRDREEFEWLCENEWKREAEAIDFIDDCGEWL